ncbi:hypothetical protein BYT27DRAFT_7184608 [Phlegmacium glaucopus]|nr:hypothetical protein BYT27DRAFT_7184608 [Phlegmacium glaucopus]
MPNQQQPGVQGNLPITQTCEFDTAGVYWRQERSFYPQSKCQVVKVQARDHNAYSSQDDTFYELVLPIDRLEEDLVANATQLVNLRKITFNSPLSWEAFMANDTCIMAMALKILQVSSLTKVSLCADILNDDMFHALSSQSRLREVQLLLPAISPDSPHVPNRVAQIGEVLDRGIPQLPQVEHFKMPLELVTCTVLSCLAQLPCLYSLEITDSANVPYPGRLLIRFMESLYPQPETPGFFKSLQLLNIKDNMHKEDLFSKYTLTKKFPNIKLIKA